jgi:hypothetical protein
MGWVTEEKIRELVRGRGTSLLFFCAKCGADWLCIRGEWSKSLCVFFWVQSLLNFFFECAVTARVMGGKQLVDSCSWHSTTLLCHSPESGGSELHVGQMGTQLQVNHATVKESLIAPPFYPQPKGPFASWAETLRIPYTRFPMKFGRVITVRI